MKLKQSSIHKRVVITGYGAVTPLGENALMHWDAILNKRMGFKYFNKHNNNINTNFFGIVENEPDISFTPLALRRRLPKYTRLTLKAAQEAVSMAFGSQLPTDIYAPIECGVILGTGWGGFDECFSSSDEWLSSELASPFSCFFNMINISSAACSQLWNLRGYQNTVSAACATGTIAIGDAYEIIKNGKAKMMLAGAGESLRSDFSQWSIDVLGALSKEKTNIQKASCPFSKDRSGFVLSEGAAVVCIEELDSALARNAKILGEIKSYTNFSDAYDLTNPAVDCYARSMTIKECVSQAGITYSELDYINAHGTSTRLNDLNETNALKLALGKHAYSIPISSTKSYSGHLISAAGAFETIVCLQAMNANIIPATLNLTNPDPECDLDYVAGDHRKAFINHALNLSFGFGGANAALMLEKYS